MIVIWAALGLLGASSSSAQQFRAAWADVFHVGMRSTAEVNSMVADLVRGHYNAVVVQVLAYMDNASGSSHGAYWKSSILPWCAYTTAGFDPLAYLCQVAHANGIEVHAWLGGSGGAMYRVSLIWPPSGNNTLATHPQWMMVPRANSEGNAVVAINGNYMLDMGSPDAQEYIVSIVRELVTNYQIDGINWDDETGGTEYTAGLGFPAYSAATYGRSGLARYRTNTGYVGTPAYNDSAYSSYRRRFKNELIARCQAEIQSIKTNPRQPLRHTSSTMAYGTAPACGSFASADAYLYFSDWSGMLTNGWLDAAIPMNYKSGGTTAAFQSWCNRSCFAGNRHYFIGTGAYLNTELQNNGQLNYALAASGVDGVTTYSYAVPSTDGTLSSWYTYISTAGNAFASVVSAPSMPWRNPATATEGIVWGRVSNWDTGDYIDDAAVTVGGRTYNTDGNGYYIVTLVPATASGTTQAITATKSGLSNYTYSNAVALAGDIVRYDIVMNAATPQISIAPSGTLTRYLTVGRNLPTDSFTVKSPGGINNAPLNYTVSESSSWLSVSPTAGTSTGELKTHTITYTTSSLVLGTYNAPVSILSGSATNSPQILTVSVTVHNPGDVDGDGDVDLVDFAKVQTCLGLSPTSASCTAADFDASGAVNDSDITIWVNCASGADVASNPGCAP